MNLSLTNFKIDIVMVEKDKEIFIPLTFYENGLSNYSATYNEKLTEKDNSQLSLTFGIQLYVDNHRSKLMDYIVNDRIIRLTIDENEVYYFVITSRQPAFTNKGLSYNVSCQDLFSHQLSRQKTDIDFSTNDETL
jgi:hypothetical protein